MKHEIEKIKNLLSRGEMKDAIEKLHQFSSGLNKKEQDQIIFLTTNLNIELKNELLGVNANNVERNKILRALLEFLSEIEDSATKDSLAEVEKGTSNLSLSYFEGQIGKQRLRESLSNQEIIRSDLNLAKRFSSVCKLEYYPSSHKIYDKDELGGDYLFMTLVGCIELILENKKRKIIPSGKCFGEFPILDPGVKLSVTAVAKEDSIVGMISNNDFHELADEYPEIWKNLAKMLSKRIMENDG